MIFHDKETKIVKSFVCPLDKMFLDVSEFGSPEKARDAYIAHNEEKHHGRDISQEKNLEFDGEGRISNASA